MVNGLCVVTVLAFGVGCGELSGSDNPKGGPDGASRNTGDDGAIEGVGGSDGTGGAGVGGFEPGSGGAGVGGSAGTGGGIVYPDTACGAFCAQAAALEVCPSESEACVDQCEASKLVAPWCGEMFDMHVQCSAQQAADGFTCPQGHPLPSTTVCADERAATVSCLFEGPAGGMPDLTADCQAQCDVTSTLPCASPTCLQDCIDSVAEVEACNGAQATIVHCFAQQPAESWACDEENQPAFLGQDCAFPVLLHGLCVEQNAPSPLR
ncbi:hypothetical protein [Chondromyces crocatus]|uniref:hypothetical protein n=1 Tax=Chondromyces crocatus TaxID=52 RepID=UPI0012E1A5D5|nr:hypothetical protein [Chondromyces crocatus]